MARYCKRRWMSFACGQFSKLGSLFNLGPQLCAACLKRTPKGTLIRQLPLHHGPNITQSVSLRHAVYKPWTGREGSNGCSLVVHRPFRCKLSDREWPLSYRRLFGYLGPSRKWVKTVKTTNDHNLQTTLGSMKSLAPQYRVLSILTTIPIGP